jgi:hypothetical protein
MRSVTALALVLALCLAFAAPSAIEAEPRSRVTQREGGDFLPSLWSLFLRWWSPESMLKEGCFIDPLSGCQKATPTAEAGCGIDPLGGCQESDSTIEAGCFIDPLG